MKNKNIVDEKVVKNIDGEDVTVTRIHNDVNGNPRWVVHFLSLDVEKEDYGKIKGLTRYNAKWYGGGYVFQSYNIEEDLKYYHRIVKDYYSSKRG